MIKGLLGSNDDCGVCGHNRPHKFDVLGKTMCPECPEGICTDKAEQNAMLQVTVSSLGAKLIHEMNKDELISEIVTAACRQMQDWDMESLRQHVVMARLTSVRGRLLAEAGFTDNNDWLF